MRLQRGCVVENVNVCREHYRLRIELPNLADAAPGQFVHLSPLDAESSATADGYASWTCGRASSHSFHAWTKSFELPLLRRAFSIAGLQRRDDGMAVVDVIQRVVGKSTRWLAGLATGDELSVMGPLGNAFPVRDEKRNAWMVAGGVGVPPMLWLAEALSRAGRQAVALCGAQSADLFCFGIDPQAPPFSDATRASMTSPEFSRHGVPVVLSTDDGSLGLHGHVGQALAAFHAASGIDADDLVIYACGPERMLHAVGEFCLAGGIGCYLCLERSMACGTGTCQSCVVPVDDQQHDEGWRYKLCCTDGPVFPACVVRWDIK